MTRQSILILGGTGFVGARLCARLVRDGHAVKVITRRRERHRDLLVLPGLQLVEGDPYDRETLARQLDGCTAAVNLVGILNERGHDGRGFRHAHVELPARLIDACRAAGVPRLLHMSALGADAQGPSFYQETKAEGEALVMASGLQATAFRPSIVFGREDSFFNRFAALLRRTPLFFPLACAETRMQPVYVGDVVEAFARAVERHAAFGQSYELCGPRVYTLKELVEYTARLLHLRRRIIPLGPRASRWQARVAEHLPGKPFSRDNWLSLQRDNVCSGPRPTLFNWRPAAIEEIVPGYLVAR